MDYAELLPTLFQLNVSNFYVALAGEKDREAVLQLIREHLKPHQRVFVGVIQPIHHRIETPEGVCERVLEAARYTPESARNDRRLEGDDEKRLRAAALKNIESIQIARQRAERELLEAREALEGRTK